jgi:hypothetical protein
MTDNEMAFWCFGLPMAVVVWCIALAALAIVCRAVYDAVTGN